MLKELYNYRQLLKSNVRKEIRGKYKGSFLGVLWSFVNPLLQALVYAIVILVICSISWIFVKKKLRIKRANKEDKIVRYIDPLTSLKNRHYLNKNFDKWEKNAIYPQNIQNFITAFMKLPICH